MSHTEQPIKGCRWCYLEEPIIEVLKKPRKNKSKRKGLHPELRAKVYERSKRLCEECGIEGKAIHHIKSVFEYPGLQFEIDNLIHLCLICHANRHRNMPREMFINNPLVTR